MPFRQGLSFAPSHFLGDKLSMLTSSSQPSLFSLNLSPSQSLTLRGGPCPFVLGRQTEDVVINFHPLYLCHSGCLLSSKFQKRSLYLLQSNCSLHLGLVVFSSHCQVFYSHNSYLISLAPLKTSAGNGQLGLPKHTHTQTHSILDVATLIAQFSFSHSQSSIPGVVSTACCLLLFPM